MENKKSDIYFMRRNQHAVWVCDSPEAMWDSRAVQKRISWNSPKTLKELVEILESGEEAKFGIITLWKCKNCSAPKDCKWLKLAIERGESEREFIEKVFAMGAAVFY